MITFFQAVVLGLVQGVTELFPISSLGQAVVLPTVFGWDMAGSLGPLRTTRRQGLRTG